LSLRIETCWLDRGLGNEDSAGHAVRNTRANIGADTRLNYQRMFKLSRNKLRVDGNERISDRTDNSHQWRTVHRLP
jgi:hypothetical protein